MSGRQLFGGDPSYRGGIRRGGKANHTGGDERWVSGTFIFRLDNRFADKHLINPAEKWAAKLHVAQDYAMTHETAFKVVRWKRRSSLGTMETVYAL